MNSPARSSRTGRPPSTHQWVCCQIGSREHYAVPRALAQGGQLGWLMTDAWVSPRNFLSPLAPRRLAERHHADLEDAQVRAWNRGILAFELQCRLVGARGWAATMRRNEWFQKRAAAQLKRLHDEGRLMNHALFAYSYAARSLLELGRAWGLPTVLGQIDPGPVEEQIVGRLHKAESSGRNSWQPAPPEYWQSWKRECELADRILVNSDWSRQSLIEAGIDADKIMVAPLAFEPPAEAASFSRCYPDRFTAERPLQLLFLGQVIVRKGIRELIEAMKLLEAEPVVLQVVGPNPGEVIPRPAANIQWLGAASRSQAMRYYRGADIFMFPTHSDGFGLTQLEAQAWKLPIISSRFCGEVVTHGRNGLVLDSIDARNIERAVRTLLEQPEKLRAMSARSVDMEDYGLAALRSRLDAVVSDIKG